MNTPLRFNVSTRGVILTTTVWLAVTIGLGFEIWGVLLQKQMPDFTHVIVFLAGLITILVAPLGTRGRKYMVVFWNTICAIAFLGLVMGTLLSVPVQDLFGFCLAAWVSTRLLSAK